MEGPKLWNRTGDMVLMVMQFDLSTPDSLSAAAKECVRAAVRELYPNGHTGDIGYGIAGAPEWNATGAGQQAFISISHTSQVAVGVASTHPVGVDVERSQRDVTRLLQALLPEERDLLPRWSAIEILCAKEAAGKAQRTGLAGSLKRWVVSEYRGGLMVKDAHSHIAPNSFDQGIQSEWMVEILRREFGNDLYVCAVSAPRTSYESPA